MITESCAAWTLVACSSQGDRWPYCPRGTRGQYVLALWRTRPLLLVLWHTGLVPFQPLCATGSLWHGNNRPSVGTQSSGAPRITLVERHCVIPVANSLEDGKASFFAIGRIGNKQIPVRPARAPGRTVARQQDVAHSSASGGIVSQPPSWPYQEPPQRQPSRPSFTPSSYPNFTPTSQRPAPSSGGRAPQNSPPRAPHKSPRKRNAVLAIALAIAGIFLIGLVASALHSSDKSALAGSAATVKASSTAANAITKAADACDKRPPASGDSYVRTVTPGTSAQARQLSGRWAWDHASNKCLTSVQMVLATAPLSAGHCTQVGYVADNPGYDPNATPPAPLTKVAAQAGPACQTAAPPAPAQTTPALAQSVPAAAPAAAPATTPAAAPAPPAATTPAACSPLSDEGTCYEPGEYCRDSDHGMSGVAGDGKSIACENNDGWRWEPV
jgi:hypothetical protein